MIVEIHISYINLVYSKILKVFLRNLFAIVVTIQKLEMTTSVKYGNSHDVITTSDNYIISYILIIKSFNLTFIAYFY